MMTNSCASEWTAEPLRVVARWGSAVDESGRRVLAMRWAVPDPSMAGVDAQPANMRAAASSASA
jgi:hypothetical protein